MPIRVPTTSAGRAGAAALAIALAVLCAPAAAGEADVIAVDVSPQAGGYAFSVTVRHADADWDHYADKWEIVGPDGARYGERILSHPHEDEQPFTRSQAGIVVPEGVREVIVRAHDTVHGFGGSEMTVALPDR